MATFLGTGTSNPGDVYTMGKIGIGTSSPSTSLEVVGGGIKANGYFVVDSSGFLKPRTASIAAAACNALFISSVNAKLYFKDSGGVEHTLY